MQGNDFHFQAPADWKVTKSGQTVSVANGSELLRVSTYMLLKPYRHALLAGATRELDGDIAKIAKGLKGKVAARATIPVSGHDARIYTISYGRNRQQITFVLDGSREYELICRIDKATDAKVCSQLVSTFALS